MKIIFAFIYFLVTNFEVYGRISQKKCEEYARMTYEEYCADVEGESENLKECERSPLCSVGQGSIVGGVQAEPHEFPHFALIGVKVNGRFVSKCGGTLISESFILTAAHCKIPNHVIYVRLGEHDLKNASGIVIEREVETLFYHPRYDAINFLSDIALLKMKHPVKFTMEIRPACLHQESSIDSLVGTIAIANGFGATEAAGASSNVLLKVDLNIVENSECEHGDKPIMRTQICMKGSAIDEDEEEFRDTCQGDSGGPIQVLMDDNECMYNIIGVTSYGIWCGMGLGSVYTRVASYINWIENIVWRESFF